MSKQGKVILTKLAAIFAILSVVGTLVPGHNGVTLVLRPEVNAGCKMYFIN